MDTTLVDGEEPATERSQEMEEGGDCNSIHVLHLERKGLVSTHMVLWHYTE